MLSDLSVRIPSGQRVLLAGPSGAGKSTLLRALAGVLLTADSGELSGEVRLDGEPVGSRPGAAGLLLQEPGDAVVASRVGRDVAFGPENVASPRAEIWRRVADSLAAVGFPYDEQHATHALSGGELQRLALAGSVALRPGLLLLDEPSAMLDPAAAEQVRAAVLEVAHSTGATLVVVEHRLEPWLDEVDRMIVLGVGGAVVADGSPDDVLADHGEDLAEQGVWVPGMPPPELAPLPSEVFEGGAPDAAPDALIRWESAGLAGRLTELDGGLRAGSVTALTGPSGAGKSTALGLLAGFARPTTGRVCADPRLAGSASSDPSSWSSPELADRVGWAPQQPEEAFVSRTVRGELLASRPSGQDDGGSATRRVDALLAGLGLADLADHDPHHLSGGEQRRLAVAIALSRPPRVVLLDEPTVGQDRLTWAAIAGAIDSARQAGLAVGVATHDRLLVDTVVDNEIVVKPLLDKGFTDRGSIPRMPLAARCGPLSTLAVTLLAVIGSTFVDRVDVGVTLLAVQLALAPLATRLTRAALLRLVPGALMAASIGWSSWLLGDHDLGTGVTAALRILTLVLPGALLTQHLDISRLGDDLAQRLRLPARPVVGVMAALQRAAELTQVWRRAGWARRVRGLGASRNPLSRLREVAVVSFTVLVISIRMAGRMAVAMDARGFAGARRRTWAEPSRWGGSDTVLLLIGLALTALPIVLDRV